MNGSVVTAKRAGMLSTANHRVPIKVMRLFCDSQHSDSCKHKKYTEHIEQPNKLRQQPYASKNHGYAHHNGAKHTEQQYAALQFGRRYPVRQLTAQNKQIQRQNDQHKPDESCPHWKGGKGLYSVHETAPKNNAYG